MPILSKTPFSRAFPNFWRAVYLLLLETFLQYFSINKGVELVEAFFTVFQTWFKRVGVVSPLYRLFPLKRIVIVK